MTEALHQRVLSDVIAALRHALCLPDTPISAATRFTEDLGLDSLDLVEVAMELEARFQVELPDDFGQRCRSVAQIAGYLSQRYFQDAPDAELECEPADFALAA
jgi:acyl carrier protein